MILHASAVLFAAHRASRSALLGPSARQMPFSKAETALPTILAWHRSCGVPHEGTVVSPISVACTPHDPELHMIVLMWVTHEHEWFSSPTVIAYAPSEPPLKIGTARLHARTRQMTYTPAVSQ